MIGVSCNSGDREAAEEFFELFKTPWEFAQEGRTYDAVLRNRGGTVACRGRCVLHYDSPGLTEATGREVPFPTAIRLYANPRAAGYRVSAKDGQATVCMGYDLLAEVKHLLACGQPPEHAQEPTLERHIALLREVLVRQAGPLVEIPAIPAGYEMVACLTHDLDHVNVRDHLFDHTAVGFMGRALAGSVVRWSKGRLSAKGLLRNWASAVSYPLVHAGLARDFWDDFDRYSDFEQNARSTYYVIPRKGDPGKPLNGAPRPKRAAGYELAQVSERLRRLVERGCEVGVHGIDAWCDKGRGEEERERVVQHIGGKADGVRMHWLYFDKDSPRKLEEAGFSYDSTFGYNNTIGFRAGTAQVFKPAGVNRLLELPLVAMDTALFYPSYLDLGPAEARALLRSVMEEMRRVGGIFTVNWHDRSISPERQWDDAYRDLLSDLRQHATWFPCAGQAVDWFRGRRGAQFQEQRQPGAVRVHVRYKPSADLPGLRVRLHKTAGPDEKLIFEERVVTGDSSLEFSA